MGVSVGGREGREEGVDAADLRMIYMSQRICLGLTFGGCDSFEAVDTGWMLSSLSASVIWTKTRPSQC